MMMMTMMMTMMTMMMMMMMMMMMTMMTMMTMTMTMTFSPNTARGHKPGYKKRVSMEESKINTCTAPVPGRKRNGTAVTSCGTTIPYHLQRNNTRKIFMCVYTRTKERKKKPKRKRKKTVSYTHLTLPTIYPV